MLSLIVSLVENRSFSSVRIQLSLEKIYNFRYENDKSWFNVRIIIYINIEVLIFIEINVNRKT